VLRSAPRIGVIDSEEGYRVDAIREAGGEPVPLLLPATRPGGGVALVREWVADVAQISCAQEHLDGLFFAADEPEELSGLALAALRLDLPTVVVPSGDVHLSAALTALGFVPLTADPAEVAVRVATAGEPRPRELVEEFALSNALRAAFSLGGGPEVIVHLSAIVREAGATGFSEMLRVLVPETKPVVEPASGWFREHGVAGLLAHLGEAIHHSRSVEGELKLVLPQAPPAPPPAVESRLVIVRGRASGTEALCRTWGSQKEVAGRCRVVDSEKLAVQVLEGGALEPNSLLVVSGCGPRGGPGLPRLERLAQALRETGLAEGVSVFTDGLPPREALGTWVSLVSPEAAAGGVIGQLRDRDTLRIDLVECRIRTGVKADEMEGREPYKPPDPTGAGYVDRYARSALPALEGAGFG
jgi:dihydroxy-acid dehydratase